MQKEENEKNNIIQKLPCDTEICGFTGDLLKDGTAVGDFADPPEERTILHKEDEKTFICPACGDILVPLDPHPKSNIYFREKTNYRYIWDYIPDNKVIYSYYLYPPEDENGDSKKWTLTIEDDPENDANQMIDYLTLKHFNSQKEALKKVEEYLIPIHRFSEIEYKNPIPWILVIQGKEKNRYLRISHKYKTSESASKEAENIADQEYRESDIGWSIRPETITPKDLPDDFPHML